MSYKSNSGYWAAALAVVLFIVHLPRTTAAESAQLLQNGKNLYSRYCVVCHGREGKGDGPNSVNMDPQPRDLTDTGREKYMDKRTAQELFKAIALGGRGVEKSPTMPAWGKTLSEYGIWSLIAYISELCVTKDWMVDSARNMDSAPPEVAVKAVNIPQPAGSAARIGKRLYRKYGCFGCHQVRSLGGVSGPELTGIAARLKPDQIYRVIQNARSVKSDSVMPVYGLDEEGGVYLTQYLLLME